MFCIKRLSLATTERSRPIARFVAVCLAFFGVIATGAAQAPEGGNKLQAVDVKPMSGGQLEVRLRLSGPAPEPLSFTIDRPARIALDLPNTGLALDSRRIDVKSGGVDSIVAAEAGGRTRLVLNVDSLMPYQTRVEGNDILVMVGGTQAGSVQQAAAVQTHSGAGTGAAKAAATSADSSSLRNVTFRRGADGSGRVIVDLSDPRTPINLTQQGTRILVDFKGAQLSSDLMRRYDAADFATPVSGFDVMRTNEGTRIAINTTGNFEPIAYQSDNQYTVEVKPVVRAAATEEKKEYKGERLTLNFQDIETRAVLQLLADTSGQNIIVDDSVSGNVTLRLQNVPWDQALDIVLRLKGLDKRQQGNTILIAPTEQLAAREKAELAARKDVQDLAPLRTENIQVNYAKATDLAALLKASGDKSLLSARGSVAIDERTNMLLVQETNDRLSEIRKLVEALDIPVRQVLIEARVVIANEDFTRSLGVRTGFTGVRANGSDGLSTVTGSAAGADTILSSGLDNVQSTGTPFPVDIPTGSTATDRYMVNLPASNPAGRLALAILGSDYIVDLELSAAQAEGNGEVVSSPRMITANQKEATIEQGTEIPYQESSSSGATTTQFKKAVLSLKATPQITPDNRVILDISVTKDSVGQNVASATGGFVPSIDTRKINTGGVLVEDGQTIVLGGILETERRNTDNKVPLLGDIPVLGHLFKSTTKTDNKRELLIFITPRILHNGSSIQ